MFTRTEMFLFEAPADNSSGKTTLQDFMDKNGLKPGQEGVAVCMMGRAKDKNRFERAHCKEPRKKARRMILATKSR